MNDRRDTPTRQPRATVSVEPHREEMWTVIRQSWSAQARRRRRLRNARVWSGAGLALAASLMIGIFIGGTFGGRTPTGTVDAPGPRAAIMTAAALDRPISTPYRYAVDEHFRAAETLLVLFEASGPTGGAEVDTELSGLARELAARSRMLMSSEAGANADVRTMLLDLELLLTQIARLVEDSDPAETEIVRDGVRDGATLARLRRMTMEDAGATGI